MERHASKASQTTMDKLDAMELEQAARPEEVGDAMAHALASGDWLQIERGLTLLPAAALSEPTWRDVVISALSHDNPFVRQAAAEAVGRLAFLDAEPALLPLLQDPDELVRVCAVESLGKVAGHDAQNDIAARLQDGRPLVRGYAALALAELGSEGALQLLDGRLARERNAWVRAQIHLAQYSLGRPELLRVLLRKLTSKDSLVRSSMGNSIEVLISDRSKCDIVLASVEEALAREMADDGPAAPSLQRARDYVRHVCEGQA